MPPCHKFDRFVYSTHFILCKKQILLFSKNALNKLSRCIPTYCIFWGFFDTTIRNENWWKKQDIPKRTTILNIWFIGFVVQWVLFEPRPWFNIKVSSHMNGRSYREDDIVEDRLISIISIPIPVRSHIYIESELRSRCNTKKEINFKIWITNNLVFGNVNFMGLTIVGRMYFWSSKCNFMDIVSVNWNQQCISIFQ